MQTKIERAAKKKAYYLANREAMAARYYENREARLAKKKTYTQENREAIAAKAKIYRQNSKPTTNARAVARRKADPLFRTGLLLRSRMRKVLNNNLKVGSEVADLGCTGPELKVYLESLFKPNMHWNNYGNKKGCWSINYIIPLAAVDLTNRDEYLKISHFTNLQPMWHILNVAKGNKI